MGKNCDMTKCIGKEKIVDSCVSDVVMVKHSQFNE